MKKITQLPEKKQPFFLPQKTTKKVHELDAVL